jgi:uncharacterized membrane-anchored protein
MNPKMIFGLFVALAAVQLAVPVGQIWEHEDILRTGRPYKFRTAPVDPSDAFRGRYVALGFDGTAAPVRAGDELRYRQPAYVQIAEGADGFARFRELSVTPPSDGDYVRVECSWGSPPNMNFRLPFDKFFMEESAAPKAEQAYRQLGNRRGQTNELTYALVRIKGGRGVIEDLYVAGQPVRRYLAEHPEKERK